MTCSVPRDIDVIVVGGGPAGAATALWSVQRGLRVLLIERARFPRHRPGETLPPGIEPLFGQLGVAGAVAEEGFARHPGTWVTWAGPRRFDAYGADDDGPWHGFQAPRDRLDMLLLQAAAAAGVTVLQPARAVSPLVESGRVVGVTMADDQLRAQWTIDAGGGRHWLARHLGIPRCSYSPRLTARYGYAQGHLPACDGAPEIVADAEGWTWTAPIDTDQHHWTRLSFADDGVRHIQPPACFDGLTMLGQPRGADVTWRMVTRPAGQGYICVGDAAAVLDPASSHGVLKAVMSGMMAGHVIGENLRGGASWAAAVQSYKDWLTGQFMADVSNLIELYRSLPAPPSWVLRQRLC